ncbi:MAG: RyR domain-containing protein [Caulobacterales bacterium]
MSPRRGRFSLNAAWAIPAFAVLTLALGVSGWLAYGYRIDEAAYRGVALFDVANDYYRNPPGSTDLRFLVARWTALIAMFGAAIFAIGAVLRERGVLAMARMLRQEVIVIGGEGIATKAFEAARRGGGAVVWTRKGRKSTVWIGASSLGVGSLRSIALPWPPDDRATTVAAYAGAADHILLAQDDDAGALVLARAARAAAPTAFITLLLRDVRLAEDAAATFNEPRTRVLSVAGVSARALTIAHPPFLIARQARHARIHALIVGFGQTGEAIARDLIVNCRTTYLGRPRITVIDPNAKALEGVIRVRAPEIDDCAEFSFIEGVIGTHGVSPKAAELGREIGEAGPVTAAYVCLAVDSEALSAAGMLQSLLRAVGVAEPPIFVRLRDVGTLSHESLAPRGLNALIPFGDLDSVIRASEFLSNAPDSAARAFSAAYRATLPPERLNDPANRSARPWDELDESFRQNNRDAVAHIPAKLASAGVDPTLWMGVAGPPKLGLGYCLFADEAALEKLAELEHERWCAQRRMEGWRHADRPSKDELMRLHPDLVDYGRLNDQTKEYDRAVVRETQLICWGPPS